jgi:hypothetical protein
MKNSNNDQMNEVDDDFTDSDDLLHSRTYGPRQYYDSVDEENSVVGVMLEETNDSFLVAMPARIKSKDGHMVLTVEDSGNRPYIRLMKSAVRIVAFPAEPQRKIYVDYLIKYSPGVFPDLLEIIGETESSGQLNDEEIPINGDDEEIPDEFKISPEVAQEQTVGGSIDHEDGVLVNAPNVSNSDLREIVEKAMAGGFFMPPNSKVAH